MNKNFSKFTGKYVGVAKLNDGEYISTESCVSLDEATKALKTMMRENHPGGTPTLVGVMDIDSFRQLENLRPNNSSPSRMPSRPSRWSSPWSKGVPGKF